MRRNITVAEDYERLQQIGELAMDEMITHKLPNGLELTMFRNGMKRKADSFLRVSDGKPSDAETDQELWQRFVHALESVDFKALATFYRSSMIEAPKLLNKPAPTQATPPKG